jgi:hypothetical protein
LVVLVAALAARRGLWGVQPQRRGALVVVVVVVVVVVMLW